MQTEDAKQNYIKCQLKPKKAEEIRGRVWRQQESMNKHHSQKTAVKCVVFVKEIGKLPESNGVTFVKPNKE